MKCSIVITTYNYGRYIQCALDSAIGQTYDNTEIVVIDDGSQDNSAELIKPYVDRYGVKYVYQENAGQTVAKNRGVRESSGEVIAFLDADDMWDSTKLEKMIPLFDNPDVAVVYSKRRLLDPDGAISEYNHPPLYRGRILNRIYVDNFICFSSSMVRRTSLELIGGFDETLSMGIDYDLWIRMAQAYEFDFLDECLTYYRVGHGNMSDNREKRILSAFNIMKRHLRDKKIRRGLAVPAILEAWGMTCCTYAMFQKSRQKSAKAAGLMLASLAMYPISTRSWKAALRMVLPDKVISLLKYLVKPGEKTC
ncbi:glycosyltransferase family 2 protein [Pseudodesulfovibrio cashew]|uniref:glycosyltransferase family 2 protein n=1 Tax=Pseudodesulfovibrio cashew TaxID=2678688 RepID=UPI00131DAB0B|nr:glycosyltransferase [Pseudodesulfovibrio cashew]